METYSDGNGGQVDAYGNPIPIVVGGNSYYNYVNQPSVQQLPVTTTTAGSYGLDTSGYGMYSSGTGSGAITPGGGTGGVGMYPDPYTNTAPTVIYHHQQSGAGAGGGGMYPDPYTNTASTVIYQQQQSYYPSYTSTEDNGTRMIKEQVESAVDAGTDPYYKGVLTGDYDGVVHSTTTTTDGNGKPVQIHHDTRGVMEKIKDKLHLHHHH